MANTPRGAVPPEMTDALAKLDTATNELATRVLALEAKVKTSMTDAEVQAHKTALHDVATRLQGLAKDPVDPVPPSP